MKILKIKHTIQIATALIILLASFSVLFPAQTVHAADNRYVDVDSTWRFYYYEAQNIIIAVPSGSNTPVAIFEKENISGENRYKQTVDYMLSSPYITCGEGAHLDWDNEQVYKLYEPEKGNCSDSEYHINSIGIENYGEVPPADIVKTASLINFGDKPYGCPGYTLGSIPPTTANYNCPGSGAVINGVYNSSARIEPPASNSGASQGTDLCTQSGGVLGWIICSIGSLAEQTTKLVDNVMYGLLDIPTQEWENSGVKDVWVAMRNIASALIVLVALVGIAGQIFNFDFISAYTIRKLLPKFFIAVILIQLSWFIGTIAVNISNTVGYSIQAIITAPFEEVANDRLGKSTATDGDGWISFEDVMAIYAQSANQDQASSLGVIGLGITVAGAGIGSAIAGGPAIVLLLVSALITGAIAMFVAFAVVALRYVLILALLVVMPLALVAWILPSTNKWFDRWWNMFFTLLAMFPIIIAVLSFGKVAALMIALSSAGG